MKNRSGKVNIILRVMLATIIFSVFRKLEFIFPLVNTLVEWGWSLLQIILMSGSLQMIFAGTATLIVLPLCLGVQTRQRGLRASLNFDKKILISGLLSFAIFGALATIISLSMGIFEGDLSVAFAYPDINPEPDVVGWGYFILALVPGIWEELAFRGLIQSKLREKFSTTMTVLLSSLFFALFHFVNILSQAPSQVIFGVVMAFFFGLGWGYLTVKTHSVIPAMISHYLVDSLGSIFLNVNGTDPALTTGFFVILTLLFPVFNIILAKMMYREKQTSRKRLNMQKTFAIQ